MISQGRGLQIYTADKAGDYMLAGGAALASGVGNGLASIGEAYAKAQEKKKQLASQGKAADALFKASPELAKLTGMTPEDWALLAPEDKIAAVQGAQGAQAFEEGQRKGRMDVMRLMAAEQELANAEREPAFLKELAQMGQAPEARPMDLSGIAGAAGRTGYRLDMRTADDLMRAANAGRMQEQSMGPVPIPEGFIPKSMTLDVKGRPTYSYGLPEKEKPADVEVGLQPWMTTDDKDVFLAELLKLPPKEQQAVLASRRAYNAAIGKDDPLREALAAIVNPGGVKKEPAKAAKPAGAQFKFNPKTGQLDPAN